MVTPIRRADELLPGDRVALAGRVYVFLGLEPMSVPGRCAELEDVDTRQPRRIPVAEFFATVHPVVRP